VGGKCHFKTANLHEVPIKMLAPFSFLFPVLLYMFILWLCVVD